MKIAKRISMYILAYSAIHIILFSLMYNKDFALLFIKDISWHGGNEFLSLQNNYLWILIPFNIFVVAFITSSILIKMWKSWIKVLLFIFLELIVFVPFVSLPYMFVMFADYLSWFLIATEFALVLSAYLFFQIKSVLEKRKIKENI